MSVPHIRLADTSELTAVVACVHDAYAHYVARIGLKPAPMQADYADLITREVVYVLTAPAGVICGVFVMMNEDGGCSRISHIGPKRPCENMDEALAETV